uniref:Uncharacterized protein n=1 Tax=Trichogramma kaykai TaxID=54128 RepID=A0ABD2WII4_9HYME
MVRYLRKIQSKLVQLSLIKTLLYWRISFELYTSEEVLFRAELSLLFSNHFERNKGNTRNRKAESSCSGADLSLCKLRARTLAADTLKRQEDVQATSNNRPSRIDSPAATPTHITSWSIVEVRSSWSNSGSSGGLSPRRVKVCFPSFLRVSTKSAWCALWQLYSNSSYSRGGGKEKRNQKKGTLLARIKEYGTPQEALLALSTAAR